MLAPVLGRIAPKLFVPSKIDGELLSRDPEVQRAYVEDPLVIAGATAGLGLAILRAMEAATADVARISLPTYVSHGELDELVPVGASDCLAELDNVERRVWEGLRHECFNEPEQEQVMNEMVDWLVAQLEVLKSSTSSI